MSCRSWFDGIPFWSAAFVRRRSAWFKRSDYLGSAAVPLDQAVRDLVEVRSGKRPQGPIRLLTHLRYFGYCMNPVSFYYCFDTARQRHRNHRVAEITQHARGASATNMCFRGRHIGAGQPAHAIEAL